MPFGVDSDAWRYDRTYYDSLTLEEIDELINILTQMKYKKDNTLSKEDAKYTWYKVKTIVPGCQIKQFKGGIDWLYYLSWGRLYEQFKEKGLNPTHYREFVAEGNSHLELYSKGCKCNAG